MRELTTSFKNEFPHMKPHIIQLENKLSLLLAGNERAASIKFQKEIKEKYGEKIYASDETFVDDAQKDYNDNELMPIVSGLWGQPGAICQNPDLLKAKILTGLKALCDFC